MLDSTNPATYYSDKFIQNSKWSSRHPNKDQALRASKILPTVTRIVDDKFGQQQGIRLLDVGCGKGWLTYLLNIYGDVVGIEPVEEVVKYSRSLYPGITFVAATPQVYLKDPTFSPFHVVVCSEVIEHIVNEDKLNFMQSLSDLLLPGGYLILTTPRGENFPVWKARQDALHLPTQPVEEWLTEKEVDALAGRCGLQLDARERFRSSYSALGSKPSLVDRIIGKVTRMIGYQNTQNASKTLYQLATFRKNT